VSSTGELRGDPFAEIYRVRTPVAGEVLATADGTRLVGLWDTSRGSLLLPLTSSDAVAREFALGGDVSRPAFAVGPGTTLAMISERGAYQPTNPLGVELVFQTVDATTGRASAPVQLNPGAAMGRTCLEAHVVTAASGCTYGVLWREDCASARTLYFARVAAP
jgi:hypothetical protein